MTTVSASIRHDDLLLRVGEADVEGARLPERRRGDDPAVQVGTLGQRLLRPHTASRRRAVLDDVGGHGRRPSSRRRRRARGCSRRSGPPRYGPARRTRRSAASGRANHRRNGCAIRMSAIGPSRQMTAGSTAKKSTTTDPAPPRSGTCSSVDHRVPSRAQQLRHDQVDAGDRAREQQRGRHGCRRHPPRHAHVTAAGARMRSTDTAVMRIPITPMIRLPRAMNGDGAP